MENPRLVIASILPPEGVTGVHTHVRQLRAYLRGRGVPAALVTPFSWGQPLVYPVFGVRPLVLERCSSAASVVWYRHWHGIFLRNALRRLLAQAGECVIYAQGPVEAGAALRARRGPQQRVVMAVHFHTSQADEWARKKQIRRDGTVFRAIRRFERAVIPRADGIVYVSRSAREALLRWLPEAIAAPSAIVTNFVVPSGPRPGPEPIGDLVTIGNLLLAKNHSYLLEVMARAKEAGRAFTLDIFGDGPLRKELTRRTRSLGLQDQVRFRGFRPDVRDSLPGYRAYVHSSYVEALPLAIIEAMAAGLPIVTGGVGGIPEMCEDGVEARFWPLDDPASAAEMLIGLLDSEPARQQMAAAAHGRFCRDFAADVVGPRLESFLLGPQPPRAPGDPVKDPRQASPARLKR